jgi:hypothetical protein
MSGRARRVLVYTAALLVAPLPVMPFERGTRAFVLSLAPCGLFIAVASFYVLRGELTLRARGLLGNKLVAASLITLLFGAALLAGAVVHMCVNL